MVMETTNWWKQLHVGWKIAIHLLIILILTILLVPFMSCSTQKKIPYKQAKKVWTCEETTHRTNGAFK